MDSTMFFVEAGRGKIYVLVQLIEVGVKDEERPSSIGRVVVWWKTMYCPERFEMTPVGKLIQILRNYFTTL